MVTPRRRRRREEGVLPERLPARMATPAVRKWLLEIVTFEDESSIVTSSAVDDGNMKSQWSIQIFVLLEMAIAF